MIAAMVTKRISPELKTARKYARAWVRLEADNRPLTQRQERDLERIALGLAHWCRDDLEDWTCDCDACLWWKQEIHRARRARK